MEFFTDVSSIILYIGILAFVVSVTTEVLKQWPWLNEKIPTSLLVIILSLILCPAITIALFVYIGMIITWYMIFASVVAAFVVALVAMDGWERVTELARRLIRK